MMYLLYAKSGHEFDAVDDLRAIGIPAQCGRVIEWVRRGKKRTPDPIERPALPNYIFAPMSDAQFHAASNIKHLVSTRMAMSDADARAVARYLDAVAVVYAQADKLRRAQQAPKAQYHADQTLRIISGPLADRLVKFRHIVEQAHDMHHRIEADMDGKRILLDPLDVRAAS